MDAPNTAELLEKEKLKRIIIGCLSKLKKNPKDQKTRLLLGETYAEAGDYESALSTFQKVESGELQSELKNKIGTCLYHLGRLSEAEAVFEKVLEEDPMQAEACNGLAVVLSERDEWTRACELYRSAVLLSPQNPVFLTNLGVSLSALGSLEEARQCYQQALTLDPNYVQAHYCLGLEVKQSEFIEAGATVSIGSLVEMNPQSLLSKGHSPRVYTTKVEEVSRGEIVLQAPLSRGEIVPFQVGQKVLLAAPHEDGLYTLQTTVVNRVRAPLPLLSLQVPRKGSQRIQRRQFFRVSARVLKSIRPVGKEAISRISLSSGEVQDRNLSAGGILIRTKSPFTRSSLLEMELDLLDGPLRVCAQVVRLQKREDGSYAIGARFVGLTQQQRLRVMRYVYTKEVQLHKKGL